MEYKGFKIEHDHGHVVVTGPLGQWYEDTVEDAKREIDDIDEEARNL